MPICRHIMCFRHSNITRRLCYSVCGARALTWRLRPSMYSSSRMTSRIASAQDASVVGGGDREDAILCKKKKKNPPATLTKCHFAASKADTVLMGEPSPAQPNNQNVQEQNPSCPGALPHPCPDVS